MREKEKVRRWEDENGRKGCQLRKRLSVVSSQPSTHNRQPYYWLTDNRQLTTDHWLTDNRSLVNHAPCPLPLKHKGT